MATVHQSDRPLLPPAGPESHLQEHSIVHIVSKYCLGKKIKKNLNTPQPSINLDI